MQITLKNPNGPFTAMSFAQANRFWKITSHSAFLIIKYSAFKYITRYLPLAHFILVKASRFLPQLFLNSFVYATEKVPNQIY